MKFANLTAGSARLLIQKKFEYFLFEIYIVLLDREQFILFATDRHISLKLLFLIFLYPFETIVVVFGFLMFLLLNDFRVELLNFPFLIVDQNFSFEEFDTIVLTYLIG
jgi:hypothetical protein